LIFPFLLQLTELTLLCSVDRKNSEFLKPKMADGQHFEKPLNCHNSATV